jgi:heme-degrading monooxygenase HmoA
VSANQNNKMDSTNLYKVVLVFNLAKGSADEELRRSNEETSFPNMLATQQGFIQMEVVKINDEKTMSIQTWETEKDWWTALDVVKNMAAKSPLNSARENILVSREFLNGYIKIHKTVKAEGK